MASHRQAARQCARWQRTRATTRSLPPTAADSHASARTSPPPSARSIVQNDKRPKSNGRTQHQGLFKQNCLRLVLNGFALLPVSGLRFLTCRISRRSLTGNSHDWRLCRYRLVVASISLPGVERVDGVVFPAERGSYYTLLYPAFSVAIPHPLAIRFRLAYPVDRRDLESARFLEIWIDLQRKNGTIHKLYDHWILGRDAQPKQPRWSVIRNVLHWVN